MKKIFLIIVLIFLASSFASSVPVWKKHAKLIDTESKQNLIRLFVFNENKWIYFYRDSIIDVDTTIKRFVMFTNDSGNTYKDITDRFQSKFGELLSFQSIFINKLDQIVAINSYSKLPSTISISDNYGENWVQDTLIESVSNEKIISNGISTFINYRGRSTFESEVNDRIYKFIVEDKKIKNELFYLSDDYHFQILENLFDLSENENVLISSYKSMEPWAYYTSRVYNNKIEILSEFDYEADYYPFEYEPTRGEDHHVVDVDNIKENVWLLKMRHNGYFFTLDNGINWQFVGVGKDNYGYSFHGIEGKDYFISRRSSNPSYTYDLSNFGEIILVVDDFGNLISPENLITGFIPIIDSNVYSYGEDGWIYILDDMELSSVEDSENLVNIRIDPNPVNDILHLRTNSDILIESLTVYDLLGNKLIQQAVNNSDNNFKINCSTLATGTYMIVAQTKNGNISNKFIKR